MPKIKQETAGKIGLFSAIMMIFGSVVGIGIFFKNLSVFENNNGNPRAILLSWIIAIVMVLCIALSFSEISSCKIKNKSDGLGGWAERFAGHKFGRFSKIGYSLVFYAVDTFVVMFFAGEALLNCFATLGTVNSIPGRFSFGNLTVLYIFLVGAAIFALFIILNIIASKGMSQFSDIAGLIKFIPIAMVVLLGIIFGCVKQSGLFWGKWFDEITIIGQQINPSWHYTGSSDITGIITSLPGILFAFEGYLVVGNISGEMENSEKNVPIAVIIGMIIIASLYLLITIGCMCVGTGNVYWFMSVVFTTSAGPTIWAGIFTLVISIFIFICIIGVLNAMVYSGIKMFQGYCEQGVLFKGKAISKIKPDNKYFAGGVYFSISVAIWWVLTIIPSVILKTDEIVDGSSIVMIIFVYVIYGVVIFFAFLNRIGKTKNKVETRRSSYFPVVAILALISCLFMIAYCSFYKYLISPIFESGFSSGWGLFVLKPADYDVLSKWATVGCFWGMLVLMFCLPFVNDLLINKFEKDNKQPLIWQSTKGQMLN